MQENTTAHPEHHSMVAQLHPLQQQQHVMTELLSMALRLPHFMTEFIGMAQRQQQRIMDEMRLLTMTLQPQPCMTG